MQTILRCALTVVLVLAGLAVHELAHVLAIRFFGGKVERVGFFPLGLLAKVRRLETLHAKERYIIFAAGPAANFFLAAWAFTTSQLSYVGIAWLDDFAFYNAVLGVFNLTPALPLDGGRIAWQFLGNRAGILRANRTLIKIGRGVGAAFIALGIIQALLFPFNITLLLAGIFILRKNKRLAPELQAAFHLALDGKNSPARARTLKTREITAAPETEIKHALEGLTGDSFTVFRAGEKKIHERALVDYIFAHGINGTLDSIMCYNATEPQKIG